jgi:ribonuclease R
VFVKLDETGADGLVPIRSLGNEFFHFDADAGTLMGSDTGLLITLGQRVKVRLVEAAPVTGGIGLELLELENAEIAKPRGHRKPAGFGRFRKSPGGGPKGKGPARRKETVARKKTAKTARKVSRSRPTKG